MVTKKSDLAARIFQGARSAPVRMPQGGRTECGRPYAPRRPHGVRTSVCLSRRTECAGPYDPGRRAKHAVSERSRIYAY